MSNAPGQLDPNSSPTLREIVDYFAERGVDLDLFAAHPDHLQLQFRPWPPEGYQGNTVILSQVYNVSTGHRGRGILPARPLPADYPEPDRRADLK